MPETRRLVPRVTDVELLSFFSNAASSIGAPSFSVLEFGGASPFQVETGDIPDDYGETAVLRIAKAEVYHLRFRIVLDRQSTDQGDAALFDTLIIENTAAEGSQPRQGVEPKAIRDIQDLVASTFGKDDEKVSGLFRNPKLFRDLLASHHRQNVQLQKTVLTVGEQAAAARVALEQEFSRRRATLDDEQRREDAAREDALKAKLATLSEKENALTAREKELDDRSNTHARRELHRDLKNKIAQRADSLRVTPETIANRRPIHLAVMAASSGLVALIFFFTSQADLSSQGSGATLSIIAGAKPLTLTIALLGLIAWYLRWMNRWFERYADAEFQLKQFDLDIDRASWVVETALEWKLSQDRPMPEHLLETISRNLFSKSEKDESADIHPADYLASAILGRASNVNLKVPGGEISLTGKDIGKLKKDQLS